MQEPWVQHLVRGQLEDVVTAAHHVLAAARVRHGVGRQARGGGAAGPAERRGLQPWSKIPTD